MSKPKILQDLESLQITGTSLDNRLDDVEFDVGTVDNKIGILTELTTTEKGTLVGAINELDNEIGSLSGLAISYGTATGTNAKTITLNPAPTAYVDGMAISFKNSTQNTGAVTLNINSLGAKTIKKSNGNDLASGNLKAGSIYTVRYNSTTANFILQGEGGEYGTAVAADVLTGKTIGTDTGIVNGTMSNNGAVTITPSTSDQVIAAGYHNGLGVVQGASDLIPDNILSGKNIFGVAGTLVNRMEIPNGILGDITCFDGTYFYTKTTNDGSGSIVRKYSKDGNLITSNTFPFSLSGATYLQVLYYGPDGVLACTTGKDGSNYAHIALYDANFALVWNKTTTTVYYHGVIDGINVHVTALQTNATLYYTRTKSTFTSISSTTLVNNNFDDLVTINGVIYGYNDTVGVFAFLTDALKAQMIPLYINALLNMN